MEPGFWDVMIYVIPAIAILYIIFRDNKHHSQDIGHNTYRNYRKTRMDKPVV
jgi:hypothetical protein